MLSVRDARLLALFIVLGSTLSVAARGDGSNTITDPSNRIPSVAGNYSGTTSITFPRTGRNGTPYTVRARFSMVSFRGHLPLGMTACAVRCA